jgi:hypothetical protein
VDSANGTSADVAARAACVFEEILQPLARLVGDMGSRTLLARSMHLASAALPWLADANASTGPDRPYPALRARMETVSREEAADGFVLVLSTFVGLLERFIGPGLVAGLLRATYPAVFPHVAKETT